MSGESIPPSTHDHLRIPSAGGKTLAVAIARVGTLQLRMDTAKCSRSSDKTHCSDVLFVCPLAPARVTYVTMSCDHQSVCQLLWS